MARGYIACDGMLAMARLAMAWLTATWQACPPHCSAYTSLPDIVFCSCPFFSVRANVDRANIASIARISQKRSSGESRTLPEVPPGQAHRRHRRSGGAHHVRATSRQLPGRLVAWDKATGRPIEPDLPVSMGLIEDPAEGCSGPIWLRGGIAVVSADGFEYELRNRVTLCRCGASSDKPFCDGTHASIKFQAP